MAGYTQSYITLTDMCKLKSNAAGKAIFQEMIQQEYRDLVFVCDGGTKLAYHSEVVAAMSSVVRTILKSVDWYGAKMIVPKSTQIFITLAEVNPITLRIVMDSLYYDGELNFSSFNSVGYQAVLACLGVEDSLFRINTTGNDFNAEDGQIVDVISGLMEEFKTNPKESEKQLQKMLDSNLGDGFFDDISNSSSIEAVDFFGLETLMAEQTDEELAKVESTMEENTLFKDDGNGNLFRNNSSEIPMKDCFVEVNNISNSTLKHYINVAKENLEKTAKRKPDNDEECLKIKRKKNLSSDFANESSAELSAVNASRTENSSANEELASQVAPNFYTHSRPAPPGPPVKEAADSTDNDIQFLETKQVSCMICDEVFKVRSKIIQHLCVHHFSNQVMALYPFTRGASCPICVKSGKAKPIILKDKSSHVRHIGQTHEVIFDIITPEFKERIDQFAKPSRRAPPKYRVKEEKAEMVDLDESNPSFQESPEENYMKLLKDFTDNYASAPSTTESNAEDRNLLLNPTLEETVGDEVTIESCNVESSGVSTNIEGLTRLQPDDSDEIQDVSSFNPGLNSTFTDSGSVQFDSERANSECTLCKVSGMTSKGELLYHYASKHFHQRIFDIYPFLEGGMCEFCIEAKNPRPYVAKNAARHLKHVGVVHEKVMPYLDTNAIQKMETKFPTKKNPNNFTPEVFSASLLKNVHLGNQDVHSTQFTCKLCVKSFDTEEQLNVHKSSHKEGRK